MTFLTALIILLGMLDLQQAEPTILPLEKNFDLFEAEHSLKGKPISDVFMLNQQLFLGMPDQHQGKTLSAWMMPDGQQSKLSANSNELALDDMCRPVVSGQNLLVAQHDNMKSTTQIQFYDGNFKQQTSVFAGHAVIRSFARLANGNFIVCASNMSQTPKDILYSNDKQAIEAWWQEVQALSQFSLFLVNADFEVLETLVPAVPLKHPRDIESLMLNSWQLRVNTAGNRVLAFSEASEEILVFDHNGKIIAQLNHPGEGKPYEGDYGKFQTDFQYEATFVGDRVLVSDPVSGKIWLLNLENKVIAAFQQPYKVLEFVVAAQHIYFYGYDGNGEKHLRRAALNHFIKL